MSESNFEPDDLVVKTEPLSTRPLRCTDVTLFEAMELVIEAAQILDDSGNLYKSGAGWLAERQNLSSALHDLHVTERKLAR